MLKELFTLAERLKNLRETSGLTQSDIARSFGISRSSVNSWEMGLSVPSTQYIVELAKKLNMNLLYLNSEEFEVFLEDNYNSVVKTLAETNLLN